MSHTHTYMHASMGIHTFTCSPCLCVSHAFEHLFIYIIYRLKNNINARICKHVLYMLTYNTCLHTYSMHSCMVCTITKPHTLSLSDNTCPQEFVLAFMMGTHLRLGAGSPVLLLDAYVAASIAQIIVEDKWCVFTLCLVRLLSPRVWRAASACMRSVGSALTCTSAPITHVPCLLAA